MIDEKTLLEWQEHLKSRDHDHDERLGHSPDCPVNFKELCATALALWKAVRAAKLDVKP